jgi:TolB protein
MDRSGDPLQTQVEVTFTTQRLLQPGPILFDRFVVPLQRDEIWAVDPDGSNSVMISEGSFASWSPGGFKIAFRTFSGVYGRCPDLFVMNADGSGTVKIGDGIDYYAWSPDGSMIAIGGADGVYAVNADGTDAVQLSDGYDGLSWSPDGTRIAVGDNDGVYILNADGTDALKLTDMRGGPHWSPDGARIALSADGEILVMNADGTAQVYLTNGPTDGDHSPAWSPDGSKIAFLRWVGGGQDIRIANADGSNLERLTGDASSFAWSPDGSMIVFQSWSDEGEIYVINANGTGKVNLSEHPDRDRGPAWSPDGTKIIFSSGRRTPVPGDPPYDLYVVNPDGSALTRITTSDALDFFSDWRR